MDLPCTRRSGNIPLRGGDCAYNQVLRSGWGFVVNIVIDSLSFFLGAGFTFVGLLAILGFYTVLAG